MLYNSLAKHNSILNRHLELNLCHLLNPLYPIDCMIDMDLKLIFLYEEINEWMEVNTESILSDIDF